MSIFIRNEQDTARDKIIIRTSIIGIIANIFLAGFKAVIGVLSHSIAITMDAVNNISDAGSSLITIIGTKLAGKQPDQKHPWGHGRIEYLSALLIAVIVIYAGVTSLTESVKKIISPEIPDYSTASLVIIGTAILVKIILGRFVKKTGEQVNSDSLVNSGTDAMMDSLISASTLAAAVIYLLSGVSLEAWLGAVISFIIIKSGIDMLRESLSEILGERISPETARNVRKCIMSFPEVHGVYDMIFHDYGPERINCSAHIEIPDTMTADELDQLQRKISIKIFEEYNIILTALGIYAVNTKDSHIIAIRNEVYKTVMNTEHVIQVHGFYLDEAQKRMQFDVIVDFDAKDRNLVYEQVIQKISNLYPEYHLLCTLDTDFSVSEA
ncbi:MAG: cation transporter [Oscillospiraceae bacterium]|nr:cation transporter [Oscillospiraceae bacterium]